MCGEISEMAEYVNHHANSIYTVSLLAKHNTVVPFMSCYPSSVQTVVSWPLCASDSQSPSIFAWSVLPSNHLV